MAVVENWPDPTDLQEDANAAYLLSELCKKELCEALIQDSPTTEKGWAAISWHWRRLEKAVERERVANARIKEAESGS